MQNLDVGRVRIRLACSDGKVVAADIRCERPDASRLLCGREAEQAMHLVGRLFALCGQAQAAAAHRALAAARGAECAPHLDRAVRLEALREHLWHCLLELPPLLDRAPLQQQFVAATSCLMKEDRHGLQAVLRDPAPDSLRAGLGQLDEPHAPPPNLLPVLDARRSLHAWPRLHHAFCRRPEWQGHAAETGAYARSGGEAPGFLAAHWLARFAELQQYADGNAHGASCGAVSAAPVSPSVGRALVETARGLLMHEIALDGEQVADYAIVAPTEWNFHPHGVLSQRLTGKDATDRAALQQYAARMIATLDPCVPWEIEWK